MLENRKVIRYDYTLTGGSKPVHLLGVAFDGRQLRTMKQSLNIGSDQHDRAITKNDTGIADKLHLGDAGQLSDGLTDAGRKAIGADGQALRSGNEQIRVQRDVHPSNDGRVARAG